MQLAPAAGGLGLGQLVGSLYEKEAQKEGPNPSCYGPHCFRYKPFATTSSCLLLALLQSWLLSLSSPVPCASSHSVFQTCGYMEVYVSHAFVPAVRFIQTQAGKTAHRGTSNML